MFCAWLLSAKRKTQPSSWRTMTVAVLLALGGLFLVGKDAYKHARGMAAHYLLERAFTKSLKSGQPVKPWSSADGWPVARLEVPRLESSVIVLKGASGHTRAFSPALLDNVPEPGETGTSVIAAAHSDTQFAFLKDVKRGDEIRITRQDASIIWFRVMETEVIRRDGPGIDPQDDGNWLVLSTYQPHDDAMRLVVRAQMIGRQISQHIPPPATSL